MKQDAFSAGATTGKKDISVSDLVHYCSSWTWRAVDALSQSKDFNPDPKWIADRLNISVEVAKDAIEGLVRIGVLVQNNEKLEYVDIFTKVDDAELDRSDLYQIHTKVSSHITSKLSSRDAFSNAIVLSNKKHINEFYGKFCALVDELNAKPQTDPTCDQVFGLELSLARLTRDK